MTKLDPIWNQARTDLVIVAHTGDEDVFLWEHSARIASVAKAISGLAVVRERSPDEAAIQAAALYHDAGWAAAIRDGEVERQEILTRPPGDAQRERGAALMEESLAKLLPAESLARASNAVRTLNARRIDSVEGQVVAEADSLEEFGLLSLWPAIRRGVLEGKGVQAVLDTWHRRKEYQFWAARLNDSFRFAAVRKIAERRLAAYERVVRQLEDQYHSSDVSTALQETFIDGLPE